MEVKIIETRMIIENLIPVNLDDQSFDNICNVYYNIGSSSKLFIMKTIVIILVLSMMTLSSCSNLLEQPKNWNYTENARRATRINHSSDNVARMDSIEASHK
jgi:hypothetical protein